MIKILFYFFVFATDFVFAFLFCKELWRPFLLSSISGLERTFSFSSISSSMYSPPSSDLYMGLPRSTSAWIRGVYMYNAFTNKIDSPTRAATPHRVVGGGSELEMCPNNEGFDSEVHIEYANLMGVPQGCGNSLALYTYPTSQTIALYN